VKDTLGLETVLVGPDGIVAWVRDAVTTGRTTQAAPQWFGEA